MSDISRIDEVLEEDFELKERVRVFADRADAGERLAVLIDADWPRSALVLAIPAGGVPVASIVAKRLEMPWDVAPVSKITLPYNSEVGYGAVAFDGTAVLNESLISKCELPENLVQEGMRATREKVRRRIRELWGGRSSLDLRGRDVILVDDGLASGYSMLAAVQAARKGGVNRVAAAAPTGSLTALERLCGVVDWIFCPNVRSGRSFAVADAYKRWSDVSEQEVAALVSKNND